MNAKGAIVTVVGVVVTLLGLLWVVQGLGIVQLGPVLCVAECEPITGRSLQWTVIGAVALIAGALMVRLGLGRESQ